MPVLDTSAPLAALAEVEPDPALVRRLADDGDLTTTRYAHGPPADRIRPLRDNLAACDARLARAPGVHAGPYPPT